MKTLLLVLFSPVFLTPALAQTTPPSQLKLSEKFRLQPRNSGRMLAPAASQKQQQLASGSTYRSYPNAMRIVVPDSGVSKMPQAAVQDRMDAGGVQQLPLQQYLPDQPAKKLERNSSRQDEHSGRKP
ncbi:hypothetical protein [Hymenobacter sp. YC55]|uniref:hypothetical protein n=1 Tax=Hymenobacter sp. YC55 TaxID=3034019 RepID=UPI0023F6814E|nr:hypothetical protein [Hymenobacter sp. YC55]MDF7811247.1 hypothetical protein [Hymenobacter sp. YC55]